MDAWMLKLKAATDAGYYQPDAKLSEIATGEPFPWQGKTCKDCPFWSNSICQVYAEYRSSTVHTCSYFDPWNQDEGRRIIEERQWQGFRRWWDYFNKQQGQGR